MISAIDIKKLWYANAITDVAAADLQPSDIAALIAQEGGATKITNVHQDTWTVDESEPSQDFYKNQLTGMVYREGTKTMGEVSFNFTIGQYDYVTKAALMGGEVIGENKGWKRARGTVNLKRMLIALTEDDVYVVLPYANVNTREANTDGAVGLAVVGTAMEPASKNVSSEYWFDADEVEAE